MLAYANTGRLGRWVDIRSWPDMRVGDAYLESIDDTPERTHSPLVFQRWGVTSVQDLA